MYDVFVFGNDFNVDRSDVTIAHAQPDIQFTQELGSAGTQQLWINDQIADPASSLHSHAIQAMADAQGQIVITQTSEFGSVAALAIQQQPYAGPAIVETSIASGETFRTNGDLTLEFAVNSLTLASVSGFNVELVPESGPILRPRSGGTSVDRDAGVTRISFNFGPVADGDYTYKVLSGISGFQDIQGAQLDGEFDPQQGLPSGDGLPGGDFSFSFTVENVPPWHNLDFPEDVDNSGSVDLADLRAVIVFGISRTGSGPLDPAGPDGPGRQVDVNNDGIANLADLRLVLIRILNPPPASEPEAEPTYWATPLLDNERELGREFDAQVTDFWEMVDDDDETGFGIDRIADRSNSGSIE